MSYFCPVRLSLCLLACFLLLSVQDLRADESRFLLSFGLSKWYMKADPRLAAPGFKPLSPGYYFSAGVETVQNMHDLSHMELSMSMNHGSMENGIVKSSRLCYNFGYGKVYGRLKAAWSAGLCYVSLAYQDNISGKTAAETRFAPDLGLQLAYAFVKGPRQYLSCFADMSIMVHTSSKWVNQFSTGISWKPVFGKAPQRAVSPL